MSEEKLINENVNDQETQQPDYQDYIDTINDLRANSVSKDRYDKLVEEKKELIEALKSNSQVNLVNAEEERSIDEVKADLQDNPDGTNLEKWTLALEYRNKVMENGGRDPFLPNGRNYTYDQNDVIAAEKVANIIQRCIDESEGNPQLFNAKLGTFIKEDKVAKVLNKK
ncbi:MAG: hypothetical protein J6Y28_08685 [Acholeplasmatales bacterium]|nr:hypothetical protein [Acholeplasmatales bacterium]